MKFILIAVYLGNGDVSPQYDTRQFADKAPCQALAAEYVQGKAMGQARAFCLPLKPKYKAG